jgi:signal transduction histidine kinase
MEYEMIRLERLNLIGEMAAGIGHEVRNPMTSVRGFLQLLMKKEDCLKYKDYFNIMVGELDRANSIITEFLSLAKDNPLKTEIMSLNSIVTGIEPLISADALNKEMNYDLRLGNIPDLPLEEKQIRQLILNLVRNGLEAMCPGGTISLSTFMDGEEAVLAVQDQGGGISPDVQERIGLPFFTTKEEGTGLGLAVCYSIAAKHGAGITFETGPCGTTFFVRFRP